MSDTRSRWTTSIAFGRWLRETRLSLGLSQEEVARKAKIDRTYPSLLERGLRNPTFDVIVNICTALRVSPTKAMPKLMRAVRVVERQTEAQIRAALPRRKRRQYDEHPELRGGMSFREWALKHGIDTMDVQ